MHAFQHIANWIGQTPKVNIDHYFSWQLEYSFYVQN